MLTKMSMIKILNAQENESKKEKSNKQITAYLGNGWYNSNSTKMGIGNLSSGPKLVIKVQPIQVTLLL